MGGGISYAFYLFKNGVRVETLWYSQNSKAKFDLNETGVYKVACFVKSPDTSNVIIKESEEVFFYKKYINEYIFEQAVPFNVSIFGSCVSRDILGYDTKRMLNIKLGTYIARQSVISSVSESADVDYNEVKLDSKFQKRMVLSDMNKTAFDLFSQSESKYLIIDLIDERFSLAKYNNSIVTYSSCAAEGGFNEKVKLINYEEKNGEFYFQGFNIDIYLEEFCKRINKIYNTENIIIHKAKMLDFYMDRFGKFKKFDKNIVGRNRSVNRRLDYMDSYLENSFKGCMAIDICDKFFAYENNKWGLAPMHYCDDYYRKAVELIHKQITERQALL